MFEYHWRAKDLMLECNAAIARGEDVPLGLGIETWILIAALAAGAAVVAVVAVVLVQRRKSRSSENE